jgi:hypothetical protein
MFTVDRIEGNYVIIENEDGVFYELPLALFKDVKEGNVYSLVLDDNETEKRKVRVSAKLNKLFNRD